MALEEVEMKVLELDEEENDVEQELDESPGGCGAPLRVPGGRIMAWPGENFAVRLIPHLGARPLSAMSLWHLHPDIVLLWLLHGLALRKERGIRFLVCGVSFSAQGTKLASRRNFCVQGWVF